VFFERKRHTEGIRVVAGSYFEGDRESVATQTNVRMEVLLESALSSASMFHPE